MEFYELALECETKDIEKLQQCFSAEDFDNKPTELFIYTDSFALFRWKKTYWYLDSKEHIRLMETLDLLREQGSSFKLIALNNDMDQDDFIVEAGDADKHLFTKTVIAIEEDY